MLFKYIDGQESRMDWFFMEALRGLHPRRVCNKEVRRRTQDGSCHSEAGMDGGTVDISFSLGWCG